MAVYGHIEYLLEASRGRGREVTLGLARISVRLRPIAPNLDRIFSGNIQNIELATIGAHRHRSSRRRRTQLYPSKLRCSTFTSPRRVITHQATIFLQNQEGARKPSALTADPCTIDKLTDIFSVNLLPGMHENQVISTLRPIAGIAQRHASCPAIFRIEHEN
jgi:hypothetical protein